MEPKCYDLPPLPAAPSSELQLLVRRLIESADLSTLSPIEDELMYLNRKYDLFRFRELWSTTATHLIGDADRRVLWHWTALSLMGLFWHDLFDRQATIGLITDRIRREEEVFDNADAAPANALIQLLLAQDDIGAGEFVVRDFSTGVVRRPTAAETAQAAQAIGLPAPTEAPANG